MRAAPTTSRTVARNVRADAHIGNVRTLRRKTPELIERLRSKTTVGQLRELFGQRSLSEIAALPKEQRVLAAEQYLEAVGVDNRAARASITAALFGARGARILDGKSYDVQIGGRKLDRGIVQAFLRAAPDARDRIVSAAEAKESIVPELLDARVLTPKEAETYLFCLRHFKTTGKASRDVLVPALREITGAPVRQLADGQQGFEFGELYDHLQRTGRLADLYSAKADMKDQDMLDMWDRGISLEQLNDHLEKSLQPKTEGELAEKFGAGQVEDVKAWLKAEKNGAALERLAGGKISSGEFQNLIYGSWNMANTPYDPGYQAVYQAIPLAPEVAKKGDVDAFLGKIEDCTMRHEWAALLRSFDPENRRVQREIGVTSDAHYLAEGLGLHMVDNSLPGDITKWDGLNSIREMKLDRASGKPFGNSTEYTGSVTLQDGTMLKTSVSMEKRHGQWILTPAVG